MASRFGRNFENPERRIENNGDFQEVKNDETMHVDVSEIDKRLDKFFRTKTDTPREAFMERIKVEQEQPKENDPLILAYQELDRARRSGNREDAIKAEDRILDIERNGQEKEYKECIAHLKQMQRDARDSNDTEMLKRVSELRKKLIAEMDYDELNYKIKKLQNSQKLCPSPNTLRQIIELKKELEALQQDGIGK